MTIDYVTIARKATTRFKWLRGADKSDMVGHVLYRFAQYLAKPGASSDPRMYTVIARRAAIDWWDNNKRRMCKEQVTCARAMRYIVHKHCEAHSDFDTIIASLDPIIRERFRMYYRDGYTLQEIAEQHTVTREAIRVSITRALELLRWKHAALHPASTGNHAPGSAVIADHAPITKV